VAKTAGIYHAGAGTGTGDATSPSWQICRSERRPPCPRRGHSSVPGTTKRKGNRQARRQVNSFVKRLNTFAREFMGLARPSRPSQSVCPRRDGPASGSSRRARGRPPLRPADRPPGIRDAEGCARIGPRRRVPTPRFGLSSGRAIAQGRQKRSRARRAARRHGARGPHGQRRPSVQPLRGRTNALSAAAGPGDQEV
jgi:hypothetical protein